MLPESLRETIQTAYRDWLSASGFKPRRVQREMIAVIARAMGRLLEDPAERSGSPIAVVEAGTGTGKTVAYSLAMLPIAKQLGCPVVIATATTTLQDQLVSRDLPRLQEATSLQFRFALAKGRQRYLCPLRLSRILQGEPLQEDLIPGAGGLQRLSMDPFKELDTAWSQGRWDGDRDHWPKPLDDMLWRHVSTDHRGCMGSACPEISRCCFYQARAEVQDADCIVTNHDLVLADLSLGGGIVLPEPEKTLYVFDEGHRLPEKALGHFAASFRIGTTLEWLARLSEDLGSLARAGGGWLGRSPAATALKAHEALPVLVEQLRVLEAGLPSWLASSGQSLDADSRLRLPARLPDCVQSAASELPQQWQLLGQWLSQVEAGVLAALEQENATAALEAEPWYPRLGLHRSRTEDAQKLWQAYAREPAAGEMPPVRWLKAWGREGSADIELYYSPLLASDVLNEQLWKRCLAAVVVSATLAPGGDFSTFRLRSGLPEDGLWACLPSPFDYANNASLTVPAMRSDPGNPAAHTAELVERLPEWLDPEEATLVLFSSRQQMQAVYEGMPALWRERILCQDDLPRVALLAAHRERVDAGSGSVVFGLASMAEGVDLPGDYCSHVVIAKLPFPVPDSPMEAALAEWVESQGKNPFREIVLPDTALRLVQACGRLLRNENDSGRITLLDRRVVSKSYGKRLLSALPPYRQVIG
ncbi:MAG: ATP-dependent DNA helicase DinG [Gammaproteobacteria bacterium]|nr:MAG: ATP-dependent DNA helicase DinG [Gammaproteobacteria bacterium]